jgi:hypothetical protein
VAQLAGPLQLAQQFADFGPERIVHGPVAFRQSIAGAEQNQRQQFTPQAGVHDFQGIAGEQAFQVAERFDRVVYLVDQAAGVADRALIGMVQDLQDDFLLVAEVLEHRRRRHSGLAGDLFDGGVLETLALKQFDRGFTDSLPALGFLTFTQSTHRRSLSRIKRGARVGPVRLQKT